MAGADRASICTDCDTKRLSEALRTPKSSTGFATVVSEDEKKSSSRRYSPPHAKTSKRSPISWISEQDNGDLLDFHGQELRWFFFTAFMNASKAKAPQNGALPTV